MASNNIARQGPKTAEPARLPLVTPFAGTRRRILKAAALTWLAGSIVLSTGGFATAFAPDNSAEAVAGQFVTGVIYKGMTLFQDPQLTSAERDRRFAKVIEQNIDIPGIARFTLGRYWNRATEKERRDYAEVLPPYLAQAFAGRIGQFAGAMVQVVRTDRVNDRIHVVTRIYFAGPRPNSASTNELELGWLVTQTPAGFRIIDLDIAGTSLELTERTDVASRIERTGATVSGAVNDMRQTLGMTVAGP